MQAGGNARLFEFFNQYSLNDETLQMKYKTKSAEFYRA